MVSTLDRLGTSDIRRGMPPVPFTVTDGGSPAVPIVPAARQLGALVPQVADALLTAGGRHIHREVLALVERQLLAHALERTRGNQLRAARMLGINRNTLHKRCLQLGLLAARVASAPAVSHA